MLLQRLTTLTHMKSAVVNYGTKAWLRQPQRPPSTTTQRIILESVKEFDSNCHRKALSTSQCLAKKQTKGRIMIKDKAIRKDPVRLAAEQLRLLGKNAAMNKNANKKKVKSVTVWDSMTVTDLSGQLGLEVDDLFEVIFSLKNINTDWLEDELQPIRNRKLLALLGNQLHFKLHVVADPSSGDKRNRPVVDKDERRSPPPEEKDLVARAPVVTIMGHIDHGKTSLLDYLRKSRIVAGEAGGITQHIGAFSVELAGLARRVTIIDTPGHAAFTAMRTRGAVSTDIVILIIDSCEGVLEQTRESLRIIRQARVPYIVALNKIDKPGSDVEAVKAQLGEEGVVLEERGGEVQCVPISALQGTNVRLLIEAVLTQAELLELRGEVGGKVEGVVIEGQREMGLGATATVLVRRGTLKPGGFLVCGASWAKVRLLLDDRGERLGEVGPSEAAKVVGWKGEEVPGAGEEVLGVGSDSRAREVVAWRLQQRMVSQAEGQQGMIEEQRQVDREAYEEYRTKKRESGLYKPRYGQVDFKTRLKERKEKSSTPVVAVVVKGDVDGSVEAILSCLETYSSEDVLLDIVHFGVGPVSETDVTMAESFGAIVYAFNTTVPGPVMKVAEAANVPVKSFDVIYHLIGDLKLEIGDRLPPLEVEDTVGRGTVMQQFLVTEKKSKVAIAGCRVVAGRFPKEGFYRLARAGQVVYEGRLASLKHMKEEVSEIGQNKECGLRFADAEEVTFESGDSIVCFTTRMEARACDWNPGF